MGDSLGQRGLGANRWHWRRKAEGGQPRGPLRGGRRAALAAAGLVLIAGLALALYFVLRPGEGGAGEPVPGLSPGTATPASSPAGPHIRLARWAPDEWQVAHLMPGDSSYREGDAIPFLLVIQDAVPQSLYAVVITYDCLAGGAAGFDFLTGYQGPAGSAPALSEGGPGRVTPDATMPIPDDGSIRFDDADGGQRLFQLWGATFAGRPSINPPTTPCENRKLVFFPIRAQSQTVFLLWGGHLASSADWGPGRGASSQGGQFGMQVKTAGLEAELEVAAGAVSP